MPLSTTMLQETEAAQDSSASGSDSNENISSGAGNAASSETAAPSSVTSKVKGSKEDIETKDSELLAEM